MIELYCAKPLPSMSTTNRRLIIHVGPPKTGTSAVQHYLCGGATPGLLYPQAGRWEDGAHHNLVFNFFEDRRRPELLAEDAELIFARIATECAAQAGDILISSEELVNYDIKAFVEAAQAHLGALVDRTELILTYRDHFSRAASLYNQRVKDGFHLERRDPDSYLRVEAETVLYAPLLARLSDTGFPIRLVSYHPSTDFLARFLAACGYHPAGGVQDVRRNVSLSVPGMIITLATNRIVETDEERQFLVTPTRKMNGFFAPSKFIFRADTFAEVARLFEADRLALQARFGIPLPETPAEAPENCFHIDESTIAQLAKLTAPLGVAGARLLVQILPFLRR
jgi:hypothetical protein